MNQIANVLDLELNKGHIIEIGLTQIHLDSLAILKTLSWLIWPQSGGPLEQEIVELTGLTDKKLEISGRPLENICYNIYNRYGPNRMLVVDNENELLPFYNSGFIPRTFYSEASFRNGIQLCPFQGQLMNVSYLYNIVTGKFDKATSLENMLATFDLTFVGRQHRAGPDSTNIARLFLKLMEILKNKSQYHINYEFLFKLK